MNDFVDGYGSQEQKTENALLVLCPLIIFAHARRLNKRYASAVLGQYRVNNFHVCIIEKPKVQLNLLRKNNFYADMFLRCDFFHVRGNSSCKEWSELKSEQYVDSGDRHQLESNITITKWCLQFTLHRIYSSLRITKLVSSGNLNLCPSGFRQNVTLYNM